MKRRASGAPHRAPASSRLTSASALCYDELVLQWAMAANDVAAGVRGEVLESAARNRADSNDILGLPRETDELIVEMERCASTLRTSCMDLQHSMLRELLEEGNFRCLGWESKLELSYKGSSESLFAAKAISAELALQIQSLRSASLEIIQMSVWRPVAEDSSTLSMYAAFAPKGLNSPWVRLYDTLTFDSSNTVRLMTRTILFQEDESSRGPAFTSWRPHFGTLL